jgi:hypothetical protein
MRDQMYAGLDGEGNNLTPGYSQDPYFKKPGAGLRYAKWKASSSPRLVTRGDSSIFKKRDIDTPNLIVTGTMIYDRLVVDVSDNSLIIDAVSPIIGDIKKKYGDIFKLSPIAMGYMVNKFVYPYLKAKFDETFAKA